LSLTFTESHTQSLGDSPRSRVKDGCLECTRAYFSIGVPIITTRRVVRGQEVVRSSEFKVKDRGTKPRVDSKGTTHDQKKGKGARKLLNRK